MPNISEQSLEGIAFIINNCKLLTIFQEFSKNQSKLLTFISQSIETQWRVCARNGTRKIAPWKIVPQKIAPYSNPNYNLTLTQRAIFLGQFYEEKFSCHEGKQSTIAFVKAAKFGRLIKAKIIIQKKRYGQRKTSNIEIQKIHKGTEKLFIFRPD